MSCKTENKNYITLCSVKKGDTWEGFNFELQEDNGTVIPLDDVASILIQFKKNKTAQIANFEFKTENNTIQFIDDKPTLMPIVMNFDIGIYFFDCQLTYTNGKVSTIFEGQIELKQDVSR